MYDPERGWSLSFAGCGFLGFYHVGATHCLRERAPHLLRDARMFFGASVGALHCITFVAGVPLEQILPHVTELVQDVRSRNIGILHPFFNISRYIRESLNRLLLANVHQLISGKVSISLTRVSDWENILVSDFQSKDEVVDRYVDGGVSNSMPFLDAKTTITVSPFYGEYDICPKVKSTNFLHMDVNKLSLHLCSEYIHLISQMLLPLDIKVLGEICLQGYLDAARFLEENGIGDRPPPSRTLSSGGPGILAVPWGTMSLEASPERAAWQPMREGDGLLDHLRHSVPPWNKNTLEMLWPSLTTVLSEMVKNRGGFMSKIHSFFPVKVLSYALLPCTLPVESAIAVVQRAAMPQARGGTLQAAP